MSRQSRSAKAWPVMRPAAIPYYPKLGMGRASVDTFRWPASDRTAGYVNEVPYPGQRRPLENRRLAARNLGTQNGNPRRSSRRSLAPLCLQPSNSHDRPERYHEIKDRERERDYCKRALRIQSFKHGRNIWDGSARLKIGFGYRRRTNV